jgi:hypothetical protein
MVKALEKRGLILRHPGQPRSLEILISEEEIPSWNSRKQLKQIAPANDQPKRTKIKAAPPANLYVLSVFLTSGPISDKFPSKVIRRDIEIRGDQTLEDLHNAIFEAYDRWEGHAYEFQMGKRPFDPEGPNYGIADPDEKKPTHGDARTTTLDDLDLQNRKRAFGYWFDFGDDWLHQIQLERTEKAIPTVTYPRVIKRVGKSPPQY